MIATTTATATAARQTNNQKREREKKKISSESNMQNEDWCIDTQKRRRSYFAMREMRLDSLSSSLHTPKIK